MNQPIDNIMSETINNRFKQIYIAESVQSRIQHNQLTEQLGVTLSWVLPLLPKLLEYELKCHVYVLRDCCTAVE